MRTILLAPVNLFLISVIASSLTSSAADRQYEACRPASCGVGPNVSFPFYILNQQESFCGFPAQGFALNCGGDGFPVFNMSGSEYAIQNIFYENKTFLVRNEVVLRSIQFQGISSCIPSLSILRNNTLPGYFSYVRFSHLYLFYDCFGDLPRELESYRYNIGCEAGMYQSVGLALLNQNETSVDLVKSFCATNVVVPVDDAGNNGAETVNIRELVTNGFLMRWNASECGPCRDSGGRCGFNATSLHFNCFCSDGPQFRTCRSGEIVDSRAVHHRTTKVVLATILSGAGVVILLCVLLNFLLFCRQKRKIRASKLNSMSSLRSSKSDIEPGSLHGLPIFSYKDLEEATSNFDTSKELGDGGFGTVYYGKLRDGREVAVKRLYERNHKRAEQFMNEISILTCLRHPHLVSLYGCTSRTSRELLLVYEYVSNGTVAEHLHGDKSKVSPLPWRVRMKIAVETASALAYLHDTGIIHRDIKTDNILLDQNFCVKVADFGLSRLCPTNVTHVSTAPQGTPGYVDPEYHQCYQLTDKSDVYSFGVVLIELISSMPAVDITRERHEVNLSNLAVNRIQRCALDELIDSRLGYGSDPQVTRMTTAVAELAFQCLQQEKELRPSMDEACMVLKDIGAGEECRLEESDAVGLLGFKKSRGSPTAVVDPWLSSSSTNLSCEG